MGRDAGFIALRTAIATGAEAVLVPETSTDVPELIAKLRRNYANKKTSSIVVVAEGDDAGGAFEIARQVKAEESAYDIRVTVLGHVQRGGRPTCMERVLASRLGLESVRGLLNGNGGSMVGQIDKRIVFTPFEKAIKHHQEMSPILLEMVEILA